MFDRIEAQEEVSAVVHAVLAGKFALLAFNLHCEFHVWAEEGKGTPALTSVQSIIDGH